SLTRGFSITRRSRKPCAAPSDGPCGNTSNSAIRFALGAMAKSSGFLLKRSTSRNRRIAPMSDDDTEYTESGQPVYRHKPRDREFEPAFGDPRTIEAISR